MMENFEKIDLPFGWVQTNVGQLYHFEYGKSLTKHSRTEAGKYPVFGSNGVVGKHDSFLIEGPALIVGRKGAAGAVSYSSDNCWPIDTTYFVRDTPNLSLKFSYYLLQSLNLTKYEKSTAIPGLNRNDAYAEPVFLPPLPEQKRIVAKIEELFSELDKGIESFKTAREQLKVYRQALLKHAFEGKLTAAWREANKDKLETADALLKRIQTERAERYKQQVKEWEQAVKEWEKSGKKGSKPGKPSVPKELPPLTAEELAELPQLPDGWGWVRSGELFESVTSGSRGWAAYYSDSGALFIRITNMDFNTLELDLRPKQLQHVSPPKGAEGLRTKVMEGDFLFSITGYLGMFAIAPLLDESYVNQHIALARPVGGFLKQYFGYYTISHVGGIRHLNRQTKGAVKAGLGLDDIRNYPVPMCSLPEQEQIVQNLESRLSEIDNLDQTITNALQQAETLRQSILKKAFSGQLVSQDPNDEPAAALLARIKAERAAHGKTGSASTKRSPRTKKATP